MTGSVPAELDGERLDRVLAKVASVSRSQAHSLVEAGRVRVGQDIETVPSTKVAAGERLEFELPGPEPGMVAEPVKFGVVFEDEFIALTKEAFGNNPPTMNIAGVDLEHNAEVELTAIAGA